MKFIFIFIVCNFVSLSSYSQTFYYEHYTVEDGLPSSQVYSAFQDSKGYIWFATDAGVIRFNGYEFENFDASDGLTDNTVFLITEDHEGRIWFGTFNCQLSYYEDGKIKPFEHNDKLAKIFSRIQPVRTFQVDDYIWLGFNKIGLYKITMDGEVECLTKLHNNKINTDIVLNKQNESFVYGTKTNNYGMQSEEDTVNINLHSNQNIVFSFFRNNSDNLDRAGIMFHPIDSNMFCYISPHNMFQFALNVRKDVQRIYGGDFIRNNLHSIYSHKDKLYIVTDAKGVFECQLVNDTIQLTNIFLQDKKVSRIFIDNEEGMWFMTLEEGIYYLPSNNKIKVVLQKEIIKRIEVDTVHQQLFLLNHLGNVFQVNAYCPDSIKRVIIPEAANQQNAIKYDYLHERLFISQPPETILKWTTKDNTKSHFSFPLRNSFKDMLIQNDTFYLVNNGGLIVANEKGIIYKSYSEDSKKFWTRSIINHLGKIWLGTNKGLAYYSKKSIKICYPKNVELTSAVSCLANYKHNILLVGTKSNGVMMLRNEKIIGHINKNNGLRTNLIRKVLVDNNMNIWIGTNKGITRVRINKKGDMYMDQLTIKNGLPSEEINDLGICGNFIYAPTGKGLVCFDRNNFIQDTKPIDPFIKQFKVDGVNCSFTAPLDFPYNIKLIEINFEAISFKSKGNIDYKYRILELDTNWVSTLSRSVQYHSLNPGLYTFEVKAKNENGTWGASDKIIFRIRPPVWKTWWFITIVTSFLILLIYLGFKTNLLAYNLHIQQELFNRLLKKLGKRNYILLEIDRKKVRIDENKVLFMQSFKNYIEIIGSNQKYLYRSTMNDMEKKIRASQFIRVHRSYIVNKDKIDAVSTKEIKIGNHLIPVGKTYKEFVQEFKNEYFRINT